MNQYEAVIFDMDGVIVDSEPLHEWAFRDVLNEIGYGETHGLDFKAYYGMADRTVWQDFFANHRPSQSLEQLAEWKQRRFLEILDRDRPIFEPLPPLLEKLSRRCKLAIASFLHQSSECSLENLRRFFPVVVTERCPPRQTRS